MNFACTPNERECVCMCVCVSNYTNIMASQNKPNAIFLAIFPVIPNAMNENQNKPLTLNQFLWDDGYGSFMLSYTATDAYPNR